MERAVFAAQSAKLSAAADPLISWFKTHARSLPWREEPTPYRVWISEIMLQQTRVETVRPYFLRFLAALPDTAALAAVPDDKLLKLWQGLGYYSRARNLKKAAGIVQERYGGELPRTREELLKLPGIGSYTAGAIASIACGQAVPAVDGNVLRVVSRLLASREDILLPAAKERIFDLLAWAMPEKEPGCFNQALMELGALICVPGAAPGCAACPLRGFCMARRLGIAGGLPVRTAPKKRRVEELTVCVFVRGDQAAVRRRTAGLLAGMYELPNLPGHLEAPEVMAGFSLPPEAAAEILPLPDCRHIFTHVEWRMKGFQIRLLETAAFPEGYLAVTWEELAGKYPLPAAFLKYMPRAGR